MTTDELARANADLRDLQRKKQILAALVVHDLRNPLSALQGNLELLAEELAGEPSELVREIMGDCTELVQKALSMVSGLLDVEELEEGLLEAEPVMVDAAAFLERACRGHLAAVTTRGLTMSADVPEGLTARFDPDLIYRVIENLLDNAVRYAPRRGKVALSAAIEGGALVIRVGNDGPPVPDSERDKIFGRYYRIEARRAGARANRGLGLYYCWLAAEAHGGSITLEETAEMPATFVLRLPQ